MHVFARPTVVAVDATSIDVCAATQIDIGDTFVVATSHMLRVYGASHRTLLYEFPSMHTIVSVHYTRFSDSIVTLESDFDHDHYLCVYHDWRNLDRNVVRSYTLPLATTEACVCVCSYSGRVAVAAANACINVWQCNDGFFEHVFELKVRLDTGMIQYVALHGDFLAVATLTELQVFNLQIDSTKFDRPKFRVQENDTRAQSVQCDGSLPELLVPILHGPQAYQPMTTPSTQGTMMNPTTGMLDINDIRVNGTAGYRIYHACLALRRFQSPHRGICSVQFLPETVGAQDCVKISVSIRLLVATATDANLFHFIASEYEEDGRDGCQFKIGGVVVRSRQKSLVDTRVTAQ